MHVILFAGGTIQPGSAVEQALATGELVIAADSGAETALELGYTPALVVGDFDSLNPATRTRLETMGCRCLAASAEKDETDTELAIAAALELGADRITLLGALGGSRFDHSIANLLLLAGFAETHLELVDGSARAWLLRGPGKAVINGKTGDLLSLFPLAGDAHGITTDQLYYPLHQDTLAFGKPRGISNVLLAQQASVELVDGLLFIVYTAV
jgi:thiamine pyrophosphokinase